MMVLATFEVTIYLSERCMYANIKVINIAGMHCALYLIVTRHIRDQRRVGAVQSGGAARVDQSERPAQCVVACKIVRTMLSF